MGPVSRCLMLLSWLCAFTCFSGDAVASPRQMTSVHYKGTQIIAVSPDADRTFDVDLMDGREAVEKVKAALDLIREKSPVHARIMDRLHSRGSIYLVYNPNYPARAEDLAQVRVALFIPFYLDRPEDGRKKALPVVISRHGIKWPAEELAAVLVHELAGHGQQYLDGLIDTLRTSELECQAYLHQELAYQVLGMDKSDRDMIRFRQQLSGVGARNGYCTPFFKYISQSLPEKKPLYEQLNPDVPALLPLLDRFVRHIEADGTTARALAAREQMIEDQLARLASNGSPKQLYGTGLYLLEGAGYRQDQKRGAQFILKSAQKNYVPAQLHIAELYLAGRGVSRDPEQAYFWLTVAAMAADRPLREKILARRRPLSSEIDRERLASLEADAQAR